MSDDRDEHEQADDRLREQLRPRQSWWQRLKLTVKRAMTTRWSGTR